MKQFNKIYLKPTKFKLLGFIAFSIIAGILLFNEFTDYNGDVKRDIVIRVRPHQIPVSFNPLMLFITDTFKLSEVGAASSECIFDGLFNRITTAEKGEAYEMGLAKALWRLDDSGNKTSAGMGRKWYISMKDYKWHGTDRDATPMDVMHTFDCIKRGGNKAPWRARLLKMVKGQMGYTHSRPNDLEVKFVRSMTSDEVKELLSFKIIPEEFEYQGEKIILEPSNMRDDDDRNWQIFNQNPIGTGPYRHSKKKSKEGLLVLKRTKANRKKEMASMPDHVVFKELPNADLAGAMGKSVNMVLYEPSSRNLESFKAKPGKIDFSDYTPYSFFSLLPGKNIIEKPEVLNKINCILSDITKSKIIKGAGIKETPDKYINYGPFPWNWAFFTDNGVKQYGTETAGCSHDSEKVRIDLYYNSDDIRTKEIAYYLYEYLKSGLDVKLVACREKTLMQDVVRNGAFDLALILWEGFDRNYNISPLYTMDGGSLNVINTSKSTQNALDAYFSDLQKRRFDDGIFWTTHAIHDLVQSEKPYIPLFTLSRKCAYMSTIKGIDKYPIHPETLLANIKNWSLN